jgi:hypothetical protein
MSKALTQVIAEDKGWTARDRPKKAGVQLYKRLAKAFSIRFFLRPSMRCEGSELNLWAFEKWGN